MPVRRVWLHILLLLLTLVTTSAVGSWLSFHFDNDRPILVDSEFFGLTRIFTDPHSLAAGLPFSLTLLTVLLAHEMGHYLACMYYGILATLPYFMPAPTPIGTLGAFIKIKSAICSRRQLFDVGIAGPLAGFAFVIPALAIGVAFSKIIPGIVAQGDVAYSTPLILRLFEWAIFPGVAAGDIHLHPVARAAWVGVFATALNLLPIGQLDGGHILYSFIGDRHKLLSKVFLAAMIPMAYFSLSWLLWAALLFFLGMKHPRIYDHTPLGSGRGKLGLLALAIFILSFTVSPVQ